MNRKFKKMFLSLSTLGAASTPIAAAVSCGEDEKKVDDVGATVWKADDPFMSVVRSGFDKAAKDTGQSFSWIDGQNNQSKMNDKIQALINSGVKALAINLVDPSAASTVINLAKKKGLPLILYNKEAKKADMESYNKVWYVGTSSRESGEKQVVIIAKAIHKGILKDKNGDGELLYFIINGESGHPDAMARTEAVREDLPKELAKGTYQVEFGASFTTSNYDFYKTTSGTKASAGKSDAAWAVHKTTKRVYIKQGATSSQLEAIYKDHQKQSSDPANHMYNTSKWSTADGKKIALPKINSLTNRLDFIVANNDGTALGAVAALKAKKTFVPLATKAATDTYIGAAKTDYMPVFGVDNTPDAAASMKAGWLTGTVLNDGINQGYIAMRMAVNSYKLGTTNEKLMEGLNPTTHSFVNELTKPSKAIRVFYKAVSRDTLAQFKSS